MNDIISDARLIRTTTTLTVDMQDLGVLIAAVEVALWQLKHSIRHQPDDSPIVTDLLDQGAHVEGLRQRLLDAQRDLLMG